MKIYGLTVLMFMILMFSVLSGISILYPILCGILLFSLYALRNGWAFREVAQMLFSGLKNILPVLAVFSVIGMLIAMWMASGTLTFLVYYGLQWIKPSLFLLFSFLLSSMVSFALGTSFGSAGTIGIVLITIAKAGGVSLVPVAGAIIAGIYVGDRTSPTSSSALLVSLLTDTDLYKNVLRMLRSGLPAFLIASVIYLALSPLFPLSSVDHTLLEEIPDHFKLSVWNLLPVAVLVLFILLRVKVRYAMLLSCIAAFFTAFFVQKFGFSMILKSLILGFSLENGSMVAEIIRGGGISFMFNPMMVVAASSAFSGLLQKTGVIRHFEPGVRKIAKKTGNYTASFIAGLLTAAIGCSQTLAVILNIGLLKLHYRTAGESKEKLALDTEDSVIVLSPLVPWNIAVSIPLRMLGSTALSLPFAFFLYLLPLSRIIFEKLNRVKQTKTAAV